MPKVTFLEKSSEMDAVRATECPSHNWTSPTKFTSHLRVVNQNGRKFQIVEKRICYYSRYERIYRVSLGVVLALVTCGMALYNKRIKHLISKKYVARRFAIPFETGLTIKTSRGVKTDVQIIFQDPIVLQGQRVNFAKVQEDQRSDLMLVTHTPVYAGGGREFIECEADCSLALFEFARQPLNLMEAPYDRAIGQFREILEKLDETKRASFFEFINQTHSEAPPRLHQFNPASLIAVLMFAQEKNINLNLSYEDDKQETLFAKWIKTSEVRITQLLHKIDSSVLPGNKIADYLNRAILQGFLEQALFLKKIARNRKIELPQVTWRRLAVLIPDPSSRLKKLDAAAELEMYRLGNAYGNEALVRMLQPSFRQEIVNSTPQYAGILRGYKDILAMKQAVDNLLKLLRKNNELLSSREFDRIDKEQFKENFEETSVDFGLFQGKIYLEELIKQEGFVGIKIRSYLAVWEGNGDPCFKIVENRLTPTASGWRFFRQKIPQVQHKLTVLEAKTIARFLFSASYAARYLHVPEVFQITSEGIVVSPHLSFFYRQEDLEKSVRQLQAKGISFSALERWAHDIQQVSDSSVAASFTKELSDILKALKTKPEENHHVSIEQLSDSSTAASFNDKLNDRNKTLKIEPTSADSEIKVLTPFDNFKFELKM